VALVVDTSRPTRGGGVEPRRAASTRAPSRSSAEVPSAAAPVGTLRPPDQSYAARRQRSARGRLVTLLVNLSSALLWTILFYCSYAVSLGSSLAVPAALVLVGHWLDGVLGLSAAARRMTDSITVVCALSAAWTGACIHFRALRDTLLVPGGRVVVRIGEAELEASAASDAAVQALADLVAEVAGELGARGFERISVTPFPTAETPGRRLVPTGVS